MKKFTLFIMMLVMCATTTFAQTAITSPDDVKAGKIYWFQSGWLTAYGNRCSLYYPSSSQDEADKQLLWSSYVWEGVEDNFEDPNQQYAFIEFDGKFYLYSVGADKFVTRKDRGAHLVDIPETYITVTMNEYADDAAFHESFPWNLAFNNTYFMANYPYNGYEDCGYMYTDIDNPAWQTAAWQIYEVAELPNAEDVTARLAVALTEGKKLQQEAYDNLMYKIEEAEELLSDINYQTSGGDKVELQVEDPDAANYIWCNEPEMSEGPIEYLIDGVISQASFFHTCWNGTSEPIHWLQVDLGETIQDFSFFYHTRIGAANDYPDAIEVQGSNDGDSFETIAVFSENLPQAGDKRWESGNINAEKAYKHLRFVVTAERIYWHMSEFGIDLAEYISIENEDYAPYIEYITQLAELTAETREFWENTPDASIDEYNAYIDAITELMEMINGLVTGADDEKTVEYVAYLEEEIMSKTGVGYPGETPRATFQALIDAAKAKPTTQARLDLEVALEQYIATEDITLPTDGEKYTLTFVTTSGRRNYIEYFPDEENGTYALSMARDTLTTEGLPLPESAVFTCIDNEDGTFDFITADGKYLTTPNGQAGTATGISEYPTYFTITKMYPGHEKCDAGYTYHHLFGLVALNNGGTFMAPNSSGGWFYTGQLPHFMASWTSAMAIEPWTGEVAEGIESVVVENNAKGIYDLQGRKVENPSTGIYIVNGKKVLVK